MHDVKRKYAFSARLKRMHRHALKNKLSKDFKSILQFGVSNPPNASIISLKRSILVNLLSKFVSKILGELAILLQPATNLKISQYFACTLVLPHDFL